MMQSTQNCKSILLKTVLFFWVLLFATMVQVHAADICVDNVAGLAADLDSAGCAATCDGSNDCNIRDAIAAAETNPGADTIIFATAVFPVFGSTVIDTDTALQWDEDLTIQGPGETALEISGNGSDNVIYLDDGATGTHVISGVTISDGFSGVYLDVTAIDVTLDFVTISDNTADPVGGGVYVVSPTDGVIVISNALILNNSGPSGGGGVFFDSFAESATALVQDSVISNNTTDASGEGGGILIVDATVDIQNTSIAYNSADNGAGISANTGSELTVSGSSFVGNNSTSGVGGAVYLDCNSEVTGISAIFANTHFSANLANTEGGAIYFDGDNGDITTSILSVTDSTFTSNQSNGNGGAMSTGAGTVTITGSTFDGNTAGLNLSSNMGGAINNDEEASLTVSHSTFSNNNSGGEGGAIANEDELTELSVSNSTFSGNSSAMDGGGAIFNSNDTTNTVTLLNVTITNNQSNGETGNGGGIFQDSGAGAFTVTNSILAGNFVNDVANDCFTDGTAVTSGGNNLLGTNEDCADGIFDASTLNDQIGTLGSELDADLGDLTPSNGGDPANGVAPAVHIPNAGSPAIDAADDGAAPDTDQRGVSRPIDGDSDGTATADIGAVESGCGDGVVDVGEDCDDAGESATCNVTCSDSTCGDGVINDTAGEDCDDAGESADCNVTCTDAACGDGELNSTAGEACEDGNTDADDGCSSTCEDEFAPSCGDGILQGGETCDDGNTDAGDDCDSDCQIESASLTEVCGDGVLQGTETCEDGNTDAGDGCDDTCQIEAVSSSGGCHVSGTEFGASKNAVILAFAMTIFGLYRLRRHSTNC